MARRNLSTELTALAEAADARGVDLLVTRRRKPVRHWSIASQAEPLTAQSELSAEPELLDAVTGATAALLAAPAPSAAGSPEAKHGG